jgi:hypothetical protein
MHYQTRQLPLKRGICPERQWRAQTAGAFAGAITLNVAASGLRNPQCSQFENHGHSKPPFPSQTEWGRSNKLMRSV